MSPPQSTWIPAPDRVRGKLSAGMTESRATSSRRIKHPLVLSRKLFTGFCARLIREMIDRARNHSHRDSMLTPPLEASTIEWGFQRGRASPLVKGGVKSPPAKWFRLIDPKFPGSNYGFLAEPAHVVLKGALRRFSRGDTSGDHQNHAKEDVQ